MNHISNSVSGNFNLNHNYAQKATTLPLERELNDYPHDSFNQVGQDPMLAQMNQLRRQAVNGGQPCAAAAPVAYAPSPETSLTIQNTAPTPQNPIPNELPKASNHIGEKVGGAIGAGAGILAGGATGAQAGAIGGMCVAGPLGAAIGGAAGAIVGGIVGGFAGLFCGKKVGSLAD